MKGRKTYFKNLSNFAQNNIQIKIWLPLTTSVQICLRLNSSNDDSTEKNVSNSDKVRQRKRRWTSQRKQEVRCVADCDTSTTIIAIAKMGTITTAIMWIITTRRGNVDNNNNDNGGKKGRTMPGANGDEEAAPETNHDQPSRRQEICILPKCYLFIVNKPSIF